MKPIYVYLKQTRHKTQSWIFTIDKPGPQSKETKAERYATAWSAKRGACRSLEAYQHSLNLRGEPLWVVMTKTGKLRTVKFVYQRLHKKAKP